MHFCMTEEVNETEEVSKTKEISEDSESVEQASLDLDNISDEQEMERIKNVLREQEEQIEELQDLVLDLSTRVAHDGGVGVCPDCNGPLVKVNTLFGLRSKIECKRCEEVYHEY